MTGSFNKINYRLRPAKQAERTMLIDLFKRMRFAPIENYQYVGFGSVAFVDFKMVHRSLGVQRMISIEKIESEEDEARFRHNSPYHSIELRFGHSNAVLPSIDFEKPSLVWLDYDDRVSRSMMNDLSTVVRRVPSGSFVALTFTDSFPHQKKAGDEELARLRDNFPEFVNDGTTRLDFSGNRYAEFVRSRFGQLLDTALANADAGIRDASQKRVALQVCYFKYKDGAPMATVGWLVMSEAQLEDFEGCDFEGLPFVRTGADPFRILVPLVTPFEIREMEKKLPALQEAEDLNWIPERERRSFLNSYRYLPNFAPVDQL